MQCPVCGHHNGADARFCSQCGTRLSVTCSVCATPNDPGNRFCTQCGSPMNPAEAHAGTVDRDDLARYVPEELLRRIRAAGAGAAMRGERRTVTMLFADIQGSTAAAEQMDPEEWAEIMGGAFQHLIAPIYRYEGTLARLQGDAILAFFGAPIAHEDDPVRAVRAGLDIVAAFGGYADEVLVRKQVPVAVRVGINTGLVVVGEVGSDLRVEYTALGDAINVAARMEQTAAPGTVRVTEHTAALLRGLFALADIGEVEVKGKAEPVRAFVALRPTVGTAPGVPLCPLVGRATQCASVLASVATVRDGVGSICAVVGEAGMGKSRLLSELREHLGLAGTLADHADDDAADLSWLEGSSRSFETTVPYATFAQVLRRWWRLDTDIDRDQGAAWQAIADAVARTDATDPDAAALLATVVGVPIPAPQREVIDALETPVLHQRVTEAVIAHLAGEAGRRPLVLVLDDLHWGDALSLALAERLMRLADTAPLALVLAMRPYTADASWRLLETAARDHGHRSTTVELTPLSADATDELLDSLLGAEDLPAEVRTRILERSDGNPLFVEQLVAAWSAAREAPTAEVVTERVDVPSSLSGLLTARLDQLDDAARHVAQVASVVGSEFELPAVAAMTEETLDLSSAVSTLVRSGIVVERRRLPSPRYAFRHALMQDAAYGTTLLRTRRQLHQRLASWLASTQPEAVEDIARHYVAAGAPERAFPYLVQAGERATRSMALLDAIKLFTIALDAMPAEADPDLVVRVHDGLGEAYGLIPNLPEATSAYQRLRDYGRSSAQPSIEVTALNRLGMATATGAGDLPRAEQFLDEARRIAEGCGDEVGLAESHLNSCLVAALQGEVERAIEHDLVIEELGASQGSGQIRLSGLERRALNLLATTQYEEGADALAEAIEAADEMGATRDAAELRAIGGSQMAQRTGDFAGARELVVSQIPTLERFGSFYTGAAHARVADMSLLFGDLEGALASATAARRFAAPHGQAFAVGVAAACMARVYALCGMADQHDRLRGEALATLGPPMGDFLASSLYRQLGFASLAAGDVAAAARDFADGLAVSSTTRYWERPAMLIGLALTSRDAAAATRARATLEEASGYAAERGITAYDADLAYARGWLAIVGGPDDTADGDLAEAAEIATRQGRRLLQRDVAGTRHDRALGLGDTAVAARFADEFTGLTDAMASTIADEELRAAFVRRSAGRVGGVLPPESVPGSDVSGQRS
jgi:class 3 adenylate cyclase